MASTYRILLPVAIAFLLLSGCDFSPSYWRWACESGREDEKLLCEMSKDIPIFRSAEQLHGFDLCEPKTDYYEETMTISWSSIADKGSYVAAGGYCDFHSRYDGILDYLEETNATFDGMLFQVHSCAPDLYEDLNLRAEALELRVTSHRLKDCDVRVE